MSAAWCNTGTFDSMRASVHEAQTITDVPIPYLELDFKQSFWTFIFHKLSLRQESIIKNTKYLKKHKKLTPTQNNLQQTNKQKHSTAELSLESTLQSTFIGTDYEKSKEDGAAVQ